MMNMYRKRLMVNSLCFGDDANSERTLYVVWAYRGSEVKKVTCGEVIWG